MQPAPPSNGKPNTAIIHIETPERKTKNMRRKRLILTLASLMPFLLAGTDIDLLDIALKHRKTESPTFGDMLHPYRDGWLWRMPPGAPVSRISLPVVDVAENSLYRLKWSMLPQQFLNTSVYAVFRDAGGKAGPLHHLVAFRNSAAYWEIEKEIVIPGDVKKLELVLVFSELKLSGNQNLGFISGLRLQKTGGLEKKPELAEHYGRNLLPVGDFKAFAAGEKSLDKLKLMPFGQKPFDAEVVENPDGKALKVHWKPGDYQYLAWFTPELPLYRSAVTLKCRLRGRGRTQMMVWWNRPAFPTAFRHFGFFELTPEWKEYEVSVGCDDPLVQKAAFSLAFRDVETVCEISEISLVLPEIK